MTSVLITRPEPDASRTAAVMAATGLSPLVVPLMRVERRPHALDAVDGYDALAFTSANGVRAYAASGAPPRPAFVVGPASACAATAGGLPVAGIGGADVESLAELIAAIRPGRVLHVSGARSAGDLVGRLAAASVPCSRVVAYEVEAAPALPRPAAEAIQGGLDWVALYSPRSARLFAGLVERAGLTAGLGRTRLAALSAAVAEAAPLPFAETHVARSPNGSALVDILSARRT